MITSVKADREATATCSHSSEKIHKRQTQKETRRMNARPQIRVPGRLSEPNDGMISQLQTFIGVEGHDLQNLKKNLRGDKDFNSLRILSAEPEKELEQLEKRTQKAPWTWIQSSTAFWVCLGNMPGSGQCQSYVARAIYSRLMSLGLCSEPGKQPWVRP